MPGPNIFIEFFVNPLDVLVLESKINSTTNDDSGTQIGLVNLRVIGNCRGWSDGNGSGSGGYSGHLCTSSSASIGHLFYFFAP